MERKKEESEWQAQIPKEQRERGQTWPSPLLLFFFFNVKRKKKITQVLALSLLSLPGAAQARGAAAGRDAAGPGAGLRGWDAGARRGECRGGYWGAAGEGAGTLRAGGSSGPEPPQQLRRAPFKAQRRAAALAGQQSEDRLRSKSLSSSFFFFFRNTRRQRSRSLQEMPFQ